MRSTVNLMHGKDDFEDDFDAHRLLTRRTAALGRAGRPENQAVKLFEDLFLDRLLQLSKALAPFVTTPEF
jgi:hypothetical protein